ncbi:AAA domain-containing protein [Venturia nashicola]|uniref:AAA domain-containing protein n=1 Tax=Venturia nashicola TaxID=86259 RepID=A0A4Z1NJD3_9PEZI|nr:AAA domain-containing protein [Venturia nashicola]TLD22630.1 AAA domain-containing protein [Venturia nashicola]
MARNTYVIGAQCTGKSTLVNALDGHVNSTNANPPAIIKEVARTVLQEYKYSADDIRASPDRALQLQKLILEAQHKAESQQKGNFFISDRSGVDPVVYTRIFVGEEAAQDMMGSEIWKDMHLNMQSARILVCEPVSAWLHDDGIRLMPINIDELNSLHQSFCQLLRELGMKFTVVPKEMTDIDERVKLALG